MMSAVTAQKMSMKMLKKRFQVFQMMFTMKVFIKNGLIILINLFCFQSLPVKLDLVLGH